MTDAPKTISLVSDGFGGWRLWTPDDADDPTAVPVPYVIVSEYILAAEHERIVAETRREALEEAATRLANARHTFCLASPGTDTEFHSWLAGLDHAATIMKGDDNE